MTFHGFYSPLPTTFPSATFIDLDARKQRFSYHREIHAVVPSLHETLFVFPVRNSIPIQYL